MGKPANRQPKSGQRLPETLYFLNQLTRPLHVIIHPLHVVIHSLDLLSIAFPVSEKGVGFEKEGAGGGSIRDGEGLKRSVEPNGDRDFGEVLV